MPSKLVQEILRVVAQPARVVEDDVREIAAAVPDLEQLVDLLLVLDDGEVHVGVVQHVDHFLGHGVLVQRHRHAAQRLRRGHRPVQARAVVADDGEIHAALEALRRQPAGQRAHLVGDLRPGPGLPDAEVLLARGRVVGRAIAAWCSSRRGNVSSSVSAGEAGTAWLLDVGSRRFGPGCWPSDSIESSAEGDTCARPGAARLRC